jgi:drug/metabolite transporter (DMT)-like permease
MWIVLAVMSGLGDSFRDVWSKKISSEVPQQLITWAFSVYSLPFLLVYCWGDYLPKIDLQSGLAILAGVVLHCFGGIYLVKALASSDISLTIPMVAFTPVWLLIFGPLVGEDRPTTLGVVGAVLVVVGSYLMKAPRGIKNVFAPFISLLRDKGPRIMLGLSMLWCVTALIDRTFAHQVGMKQYALMQMIGIVIAQGIVFWKQGIPFKFVITKAKILAPVGVFNALSFIPYLTALAIAPAYYVVSGKRTSILFSVLLGAIVFKEKKAEKRLGAALIMFVGVILISFSM